MSALKRRYKFSEQYTRGARAASILKRVYSDGYVVVDGTGHHDRQQGVDGVLIKRLDVNEIIKVDWKLDRKIAYTDNITIEAVSQRFGGHIEYVGGLRKAIGGRVVKPGWAITSEADRIIFYSPYETRAYELSMIAIRANWSAIQNYPLQAVETEEDDRNWITENYYVPKIWLTSRGILLREIDTRPPWTLKYSIPPGARLVWARIRGAS